MRAGAGQAAYAKIAGAVVLSFNNTRTTITETDSALEEYVFEPSVPLVGTGRRCSTGKHRQCEVAHTSPPAGTITYGATRG